MIGLHFQKWPLKRAQERSGELRFKMFKLIETFFHISQREGVLKFLRTLPHKAKLLVGQMHKRFKAFDLDCVSNIAAVLG